MKTGDTILHIAVFEGKVDLVRELLTLLDDDGPLFDYDEINAKNDDGNTALSYACIRGSLELVKILHKTGANMLHKNNAMLSPLLLAIYHSHYFVVHYLLSIE